MAYFNFIPLEGTAENENKIIPISEVELNKNYAMVITTNAGLWRYKIGTIKFTSLNPYRIKVSGRTKHFINVFGEEVIIDNTEKALAKVSLKTGCTISNYTVGPIFKEKTKGSHEWIIELKKNQKT